MAPEQLVEEYGSYVNSLVFKMVRNRRLAEDISQEVWLEILQSIEQFKGESKLSTWIYTITSRIALNRSRRERALNHEEFDEFFSKPLEYTEPNDAERDLWVKDKCERCVTSFLRCLKHEERLSLLLHDFLELDYVETAEITGKSEAALRKQVSRGRAKIAQCLSSVCPLVGDKGSSRCHIQKEVEKSSASKEMGRFRKAFTAANELTLLNKTFPSKNYWEKFI